MAYTTIDDPEAYFQVKIWTGTGSSNALTLDGDTDMQPDLVWIKSRSDAQNNILTDAVRGTNKNLYSDATSAEATTTDNITAFGSDGFTVAGVGNETNGSSKTYVAWNWKESATSGFDIIQFTGNSTARTISHSLSAVPKMILMKNITNGAAQWVVYHVSTGNTQALYLNTSATPTDVLGFFNDTDPTSSVFTVGTDTAVNGNTNGQICYAWSEKQGFSSMGSYIGNGNADGPFIWTNGMRPAMIIIKSATEVRNWRMFDNKRSAYNLTDEVLYPDLSNAEATGDSEIDMLSNGFKLRKTSDNTSGETYIYMAFAEAPFVNSNGVPCNAR